MRVVRWFAGGHDEKIHVVLDGATSSPSQMCVQLRCRRSTGSRYSVALLSLVQATAAIALQYHRLLVGLLLLLLLKSVRSSNGDLAVERTKAQNASGILCLDNLIAQSSRQSS